MSLPLAVGAAESQGLDVWLSRIEDRVRDLVASRKGDDPDPDDPFRGLYLTPERVARILEQGRDALPGPADRLVALIQALGLSKIEVSVLLVAAAPDIDPRFEQLFGYLNDDVTRRRASVGLALAIAGADPADARARSRVGADAPLRRSGLLVVEDPDRPFLGRALRAPDRVVAHLLGDRSTDPAVTYRSVAPEPATDAVEAALRSALSCPGGRVLAIETAPGSAAPAVAAAAADLGRPMLAVALDVEGTDADTVAAAALDAVLLGAVLVIGPLDAIAADTSPIAPLVGHPAIVAFTAGRGWDPAWPGSAPATLEIEAPSPARRAAILRSAAELPDDDEGRADAAAIDRLAGPLRLGPEGLRQVVAIARMQAELDATPLRNHLRAGVRTVNGAALDHLTRRIEPTVSWQDLVLPSDTLRGLQDVSIRARHRDTVLGEWGMRPGGGRGRGVVALFAGDSGTGKTMSAEVVAADLGLELFVVDLSTVVDKYIGETEKNLEKIFTAAAGMSAVLLFDEADAVFGKRSEVRDAHDRYANVESAYLLQRIERFDGIAILTTNLRANVDDAFTRRLDLIVDFPFPDEEQRLLLWDKCLGTAAPRGGDLDLVALSQRFDLAGGSIRSCVVAAAYAAAATSREITMRHLAEAVRQEYRKEGRLAGAALFEPWV